jgi:O-antigen ligase
MIRQGFNLRQSALGLVAAAPSGTAAFWVNFKRPLSALLSFEFVFAVFVFAGPFKANPTFSALVPVDLTLLFGPASVVIGGTILLRHGLYRPAAVPISLYFVLCAWIVLSMFWTKGEEFAPIATHLLRIVVLNGWILIGACGIVAANGQRLGRFLAVILVLATITAVDWIFSTDSLTQVGFLDDHSYHNSARLMATGFVVALGVMVHERLLTTAWLASATAALVCFYALLTNGARGPLIGMILGALTILMMTVRLTDRRMLVHVGAFPALGLIAGLIAFIVVLLLSGVETWTFRRFENLLRFFSSLGMPNAELDGDSSAETRTRYMESALRYWAASWHTILFGNGLLSFSELYIGRYVPGANPHNILIEILTEFGLIGLFIFIAFAVSLLMPLFSKTRTEDGWGPTVIALFLGAAFFSLTSADMVIFFYFLLHGGLLLSFARASMTDH